MIADLGTGVKGVGEFSPRKMLGPLDIGQTGHYTGSMILTEEGIVDYLVCPLRYAFIWHYNLPVPEVRRLYRQCVRSGLSACFRLLHEGQMNLDNLREAMQPDILSLPKELRMFMDTVMVRYANSLLGRRVLAYDLPVTVDAADITFAGVIDVLLEEDGNVVAAHVDDSPSSLEIRAKHAVFNLIQLGLPTDVTVEAANRGQYILWRSLRLSGSGIEEETKNILGSPKQITFLENIGHCVKAKAFHPRWSRSACRSCGFCTVCDPEWGLPERVSHPKSTAAELQARIRNASSSS